MPKWAKVLMIVVGVGLIILMLAGYVGARILSSAAAEFEDSMNAAAEEGAAAGRAGTLEGCVDGAAGELGDCEGLTCAPRVTSFLWGCLEAAPYDATFCDTVPEPIQDDAVIQWGERACQERGLTESPICVMTMSVVPAFCDSRP